MTPILSTAILRTQSDARLVALVHQGYERAFEAVVERYRKPLQRYCRRVLTDSRSEDSVQQTFLKAWSALQAGEQVNDLKPWLYRIARNNALDALKKAGYDYDELSESLHAAGTPGEDVERRTVMRETLAGVAALPERQRDVLLRLAVEGKSRAEIAAELGISDGAVRQLAHRARMTLRTAVTAVTPLPLAGWAAAFGRHDGSLPERITELAASGGAAGVTATLAKGGAVIVAAGVVATAPSAVKSTGQQDPSLAKAPQGANGNRTSARGVFSSSAGSGEGERNGVEPRGGVRAAKPAARVNHSERARGDDRRGPGDGRLNDASDDRSGPGGGDHRGRGRGGDELEAQIEGGDGSGPGGGPGSGSSGPGPSGGGDPSGSGDGLLDQSDTPPEPLSKHSSGRGPDR